ncbi:DMT family transporter [Candidatus Gottesmanbacteria bacterium]|nr:DMT family transporter [Candidatus Gottesmanbacteria bacterium]
MQTINKGFAYIIFAGFFYAVMAVFVRLLAKEIPVFSQVFLRYIVASTVAFSFAKVTKTDLKMKNARDYFVMLFIAVVGYSLSTLFFTFAVLHTTIANTIFIFSTYVIITPILGFIFLHEKISRFIILALILSFIGLYLLLNPANLNSSLGGIFALIGAILNASYFIGSRKLRNYPAKLLLFYSTICGVISMGIISLFFERNFYIQGITPNIFSLSKFSWIIVFLFGIDNFLAWLLLNKGLQTVKAGTSSIILLIEPVLASILGIIFYMEIPQITSILGMIIISSGIILATKEK